MARDRRENAGVRMHKFLAQELELEEDELFAEEVNDAEFITRANDERDIFDSDFANTSSASSDDSEDEEGAVVAAERAERKASRKSRILPIGVLGKSRGRPSEERPAREPKGSKRRRLSPGGTSFIGGGSLGERASSRSATVQYKLSVDDRQEEDESKRLELASRNRSRQLKQPRRRSLTQAELVAEALETEDLNRASLKAFYAAEEERKETQAHAGRAHRILGPTLSLVSRTSAVLTDVAVGTAANARDPAALPAEPVCRNYIAIRDMDVSEAHLYGAVLGYHTDWATCIRTPRPPVKQKAVCAITGQPARYRDPVTGAPYNNAQALAILRGVHAHGSVFSETLGCFVGPPDLQ